MQPSSALRLVTIVLILLALACGGWKWGYASAPHRSAGWTWDDGAAQVDTFDDGSTVDAT